VVARPSGVGLRRLLTSRGADDVCSQSSSRADCRGAGARPLRIAVGLSPLSLTRIEMFMHHDLPATNRATEPADIGLGSAADGAMAAPRIAFRISIGAGSILLLIVAALLLGAALSKAVAMA
jgi:hypothetical protein